MLKSKIHRATVTGILLDYEGSLAIDGELMAAADILPYEQVHVYNITNGERFQTYAIESPAGSGTVELRGAAAKKGDLGDLIIVACFTAIEDKDLQGFAPRVVCLNKMNRIKEEK
jgi:aspartate 1-decarboxylase